MSDALTDIAGDNNAAGKVEKLFDLKDKFGANPSPVLADDIITNLEIVKGLPRGYFFSGNSEELSKEAEKYCNYLFYEID